MGTANDETAPVSGTTHVCRHPLHERLRQATDSLHVAAAVQHGVDRIRHSSRALGCLFHGDHHPTYAQMQGVRCIGAPIFRSFAHLSRKYRPCRSHVRFRAPDLCDLGALASHGTPPWLSIPGDRMHRRHLSGIHGRYNDRHVPDAWVHPRHAGACCCLAEGPDNLCDNHP